MPSRRKYLRRKYSVRSMRRRLRLRKLEVFAVYGGAAILLLATLVLLRGFFTGGPKKINIPPENVAAFKIPHKALSDLRLLSSEYGVDFPQAVSLYSVENNFFPAKAEAAANIEESFMRNYESIRKSYRPKDLEPYYSMLSALIGEIKYFPVPTGYDDEDSYMYGDGWNEKTNKGVDIIDRENIHGRIPIVSMTAGVVMELGWKEKTGFQIVIRTSQDTYYTYSRLDSFSEQLALDSVVQPGTLLGYMGGTGAAPARVHISIAPVFAPAPKDFFINPYPFLRLIEESRISLTDS